MKFGGLALIAAALAVPFIWLPSIAVGRDVIALGSQYLGMVALITMAFSQVIATRLPGVEAVFGPLDQSYRLHKWLGIGAMGSLLLHDTIDADMRSLGRQNVLQEIAETSGELSMYALLILVVITVATFIPYHLWMWTHRIIGIFYIMGAFHYLFILKPFANGDPLGLYMGGVCAVGIAAFAYTALPAAMRAGRRYTVAGVSQTGNALAIDLTPQGRGISHRAGQFGFFEFPDTGLRERHPFTISSAPRDDGSKQITVAALGDYTHALRERLKTGQAVRVSGAHGQFGRSLDGRQVWIAAGVGITPYLALAEAVPETGADVTLIYCVRDSASAAHLMRVEAMAKSREGFDLQVWESGKRGRLTAEGVNDVVGGNIGEAIVLFCGPAEMRRTLAKGLARVGVTPRNFHYEEFEIRTGIGLRRIAAWLWRRIAESRA